MAKQKRYSAQLKFQVVLESLQRKRPDAEIARAYGVHPITLAKWKKHFVEHGSEVFGGCLLYTPDAADDMQCVNPCAPHIHKQKTPDRQPNVPEDLVLRT